MKNEFAIYINIALLFSTVAMAVLHETHKFELEKEFKHHQIELAEQARAKEIQAASQQQTQSPPQRVDRYTVYPRTMPVNNLSLAKSSNIASVGQYRQKFPASAQAEVHAIGVYGAENPDKVVWWNKCGGMPRDECFKIYAGQHETGVIQVNVSYNINPIVLVLMSYESVQWDIQPNGTRIEAVILGGYNGQSITGINASTPILAYTRENSKCGSCTKGDGFFFGYTLGGTNDFAQKIFDITGKRLSTFQGTRTGSSFSITDYTPKLDFQTAATP